MFYRQKNLCATDDQCSSVGRTQSSDAGVGDKSAVVSQVGRGSRGQGAQMRASQRLQCCRCMKFGEVEAKRCDAVNCVRYLSSESAFTDDRPVGIIQQCCARWSLSLKHTLSRVLCPAFGRHRGNYLVTLYLLVKLLYIGNVIGQLYMLNSFLGASYHSYGLDVINAVMNGTEWIASPMFPRVTLCDLRVRIPPSKFPTSKCPIFVGLIKISKVSDLSACCFTVTARMPVPSSEPTACNCGATETAEDHKL